MEFIRRAECPGRVVGLLPGAWNPPTSAHTGLASAALAYADEIVLVIPRVFPHKGFEGPSFETRTRWLDLLSRRNPRFSAAVSEGGLFIEMAREARHCGVRDVWIICGADAAERIAKWPYPGGEEIERQLETGYGLLVAPRIIEWTPPPNLASRIKTLPLAEALQNLSSTSVRERIRRGEPWRELVPEELREAVAAAYGCS